MTYRNIKQIDLCNKSSINKALISNYLSGKYKAKQNKLHKLTIVFDVSENLLMGYDVDMDRNWLPDNSEDLSNIKIENVHIDKEYMVGGLKTEASIDRVIPLHKRTIPFIQRYYDKAVNVGYECLIVNSLGTKMKYSNYRREKWDIIMEQLKFSKEHKPHNTRHTFATRMDRTPVNKLRIKKNMGHASKIKFIHTKI